MTEERKMTVGQYLRRERERQDKSLESVAQVTRITLKNLEALEQDNFQVFSAPVFIRGFLRTYAGHLGLDLQEVIRLFEAQMGDAGKPPSFTPSLPAEGSRPILRYLLAVIAIIFVIYIGFRVRESQKPSTTQPSSSLPSSAMTPAVQEPFRAPPSKPASPSEKAKKTELPPKGKMAAQAPSLSKEPVKSLPEGKKPSSPRAQTAAPPSGEGGKAGAPEHVLTVKASEVTWMRIRTGQSPEIDVILRPNETVTYRTTNAFKIDLGNAGGVELIFNGKSQGKLGKSGEVVRLTLPAQSPGSGEGTRQP